MRIKERKIMFIIKVLCRVCRRNGRRFLISENDKRFLYLLELMHMKSSIPRYNGINISKRIYSKMCIPIYIKLFV